MNFVTISVSILLILTIGPASGANKFANLVTKVTNPIIKCVKDHISSGFADTLNKTVRTFTGALKCNPNDSVPVSVPFYTLDDDGNVVKLDYTEKPPTNETLREVEKATKKIEFYLYTRQSKHDPEDIYIGDGVTLFFSKWDSDRPTVFSTHGFQSSYKSGACQYIKDAFLDIGDYNVVLMNWKEIAKQNYVTTASSVKYVARTLTRLIQFFIFNGMDPNTTTVVGHSLGAHVAGIGSFLSNASIYYVVGLDPAGPLFEYHTSPSELISPISGQHVDIIHTNAGQLGVLKNVGKHDFYINGGKSQPNCTKDPISGCSHSRSWEFFAEALKHTETCIASRCYSYDCFKDSECQNKTTYVARPNIKKPIGRFYMHTLGAAPYCIGSCGVSSPVSSNCVHEFLDSE